MMEMSGHLWSVSNGLHNMLFGHQLEDKDFASYVRRSVVDHLIEDGKLNEDKIGHFIQWIADRGFKRYITLAQHPVLLAKPVWVPESVMKLIVSNEALSGCYVAIGDAPILSLYAAKRESGMVISFGSGVISVTAVLNRKIIAAEWELVTPQTSHGTKAAELFRKVLQDPKIASSQVNLQLLIENVVISGGHTPGSTLEILRGELNSDHVTFVPTGNRYLDIVEGGLIFSHLESSRQFFVHSSNSQIPRDFSTQGNYSAKSQVEFKLKKGKKQKGFAVVDKKLKKILIFSDEKSFQKNNSPIHELDILKYKIEDSKWDYEDRTYTIFLTVDQKVELMLTTRPESAWLGDPLFQALAEHIHDEPNPVLSRF
eukprot:TRINITY_DN1155_c0_g1_i7.p2 TRINITY_DN1155_c0_g1~~TRINITY_DN1155_c0_g1_i7.p2  ORF type:complete len:370 (+),score=122.62 TRINITY_DN1155_c0_g1_i7:1401-2510(+)